MALVPVPPASTTRSGSKRSRASAIETRSGSRPVPLLLYGTRTCATRSGNPKQYYYCCVSLMPKAVSAAQGRSFLRISLLLETHRHRDIYIYIYAHIYLHTCTHTYLHTYIHTYTTHITFARTHTHVLLQIYIYIYIYLKIYVCVSIYIYIYIYIYACVWR